MQAILLPGIILLIVLNKNELDSAVLDGASIALPLDDFWTIGCSNLR